jgi:hypothetical protein
MSGYAKYSFLTGPQHCGHPIADGASLVIPSKFVDLDEQVRTTDIFHASVVTRLQRRHGITMSDLQEYDLLSEEDFRNADSPWYTAPVIVPINRDRYNIIHVSAVRFARVNNTCVLRWRCIDKSYEQKPSEEYIDEIYDNDPCFWEYFVVGAPCSINKTLNKGLNLVNAMKGTQFSLTMNSDDEQNDVDAALGLYPPGSVIDIPCPQAINIALKRAMFDDDQIRALKQYSLSDSASCFSPMYASQGSRDTFPINRPVYGVSSESESDAEYSDNDNDILYDQEDVKSARGQQAQEDIVVPILRCLSRTRERIQGYGTKRCDPFTVTLQQRFPIDSDFAITVNRSQGQTLDNVILAISHRQIPACNFRYSGIYVAFSRVRERKNIRLLLVGNTIPQKWSSICYISNLKPDPFCQAVLNGWSNLGGDDWQIDEWSPIMTRRAYENIRPRKKTKQY